MNCKNAAKLIVLFSELTPVEKTQLEEHIKNCPPCSHLFLEVQNHQSVFATAQTWKPEIKNQVAFTDQIMEALPDKKLKSERKRSSRSMLFQWTPLQTGLAVCSLLLTLTFAVESSRPTPPIQDQAPIKNGVALSSDHEKLIQAKRSRTERFSLEETLHQNNTFALSNY